MTHRDMFTLAISMVMMIAAIVLGDCLLTVSRFTSNQFLLLFPSAILFLF